MTECFVALYVTLYATEKQPHLYTKSLEDSNIIVFFAISNKNENKSKPWRIQRKSLNSLPAK